MPSDRARVALPDIRDNVLLARQFVACMDLVTFTADRVASRASGSGDNDPPLIKSLDATAEALPE